MATDVVGVRAVRLAREAVARVLGLPVESAPAASQVDAFRERRGAFVSWYDYPEHRLRGCIGFPEAVLPLGAAIREAAVSAALEDPRFPPVEARELASLVAEVSILTPLSAIEPGDRPHTVRIGRDGLVVERGSSRGLLLPQVAPEQGWTPEEFLDGACEKAGLPRGAWRSTDVRVYRFEAEVFGETSPEGPVLRRDVSR